MPVAACLSARHAPIEPACAKRAARPRSRTSHIPGSLPGARSPASSHASRQASVLDSFAEQVTSTHSDTTRLPGYRDRSWTVSRDYSSRGCRPARCANAPCSIACRRRIAPELVNLGADGATAAEPGPRYRTRVSEWRQTTGRPPTTRGQSRVDRQALVRRTGAGRPIDRGSPSNPDVTSGGIPPCENH